MVTSGGWVGLVRWGGMCERGRIGRIGGMVYKMPI